MLRVPCGFGKGRRHQVRNIPACRQYQGRSSLPPGESVELLVRPDLAGIHALPGKLGLRDRDVRILVVTESTGEIPPHCHGIINFRGEVTLRD